MRTRLGARSVGGILSADREDFMTTARTRLLEGLPVREERMTLAGIETAVLAGGDGPPLVLLHGPGAARSACRELEAIAAGQEIPALDAIAAHARGALLLADDDAAGALESLRRAARAWQELRAPYETARVRVLAARACRALGDEDAAELELDAARQAFAALGAEPDLARLGGSAADAPHGLSERERQVLLLLAGGATNRAIADELVLSVRTVDRHVSNIYAKLGVSSRAAATAYAHRHGLV